MYSKSIHCINDEIKAILSFTDFFSTCCIAFIVFGLSILAFYTLTVNVYRRQPLLVTNGNASNHLHGSEANFNTVFYPYIIPGGSYIPFMVYSNYISNVAMQYPLLNINVIFLLDDSIPNAKHIKLLKKLSPPSYNIHDSTLDQSNKREIGNIEKKYPNINVTIMPLSKYMAMTPHRYKWRTFPIYYLSFYVRIFAVWRHGGIAMDLTTHNNIFNMHKHPDRRIAAIMKQHNDGFEREKYISVLKKINQDEQNELFTMFYLLINHVLNETTSFFNRSLWPDAVSANGGLPSQSPLLKSKKIKRNIVNRGERGESDLYSLIVGNETTRNSVLLNHSDNLSSPENHTHRLVINNSRPISHTEQIINSSSTEKISIVLLNDTNKSKSSAGFNSGSNSSIGFGELYPYLVFYDVSIVSDNIPNRPEPINPPRQVASSEKFSRLYDNFNIFEHLPITSPVLTISTDGTFVAAPSKHHPFLENLIACGFQGVSPTFVVNRALMTQCTGLFKNDVYCDNIYVL